jgi:hypothetical protein
VPAQRHRGNAAWDRQIEANILAVGDDVQICGVASFQMHLRCALTAVVGRCRAAPASCSRDEIWSLGPCMSFDSLSVP